MREQLALVLRQQPQEVPLRRRQRHGLARDRHACASRGRSQFADLEHPLARRDRPPQRRAQAREQLVAAERLRDVVVRTRVERGDLLLLLSDRREHQDRRVDQRAQLAADVRAAAVGQQQVEDHRFGRAHRRLRERLLRCRRRVDRVARVRSFICSARRICGSSSTTRTRAPLTPGPRTDGSANANVAPLPVVATRATAGRR